MRPEVGLSDSYCASLDSGLFHKLDVIMPFIPKSIPGEILDLGTGTGAIAAALADVFPGHRVFGIDIAPFMVTTARERYGRRYPNLTFRAGDVTRAHGSFASTAIVSSVLHEVYSYSCDSMAAVMQCLRATWNSLRPGGRIIIRDFVRPKWSETRVRLIHRRGDIVPGHDFASFAQQSGHSIRLDGISANEAYTYETDLGSACEFILRKDYHELWDFELAERYGFWSLQQAEHSLRAAGFRIVQSRLLRSDWLSVTRMSDRISLLEARTGKPLRLPPCHCFIVGEKEHS